MNRTCKHAWPWSYVHVLLRLLTLLACICTLRLDPPSDVACSSMDFQILNPFRNPTLDLQFGNTSVPVYSVASDRECTWNILPTSMLSIEITIQWMNLPLSLECDDGYFSTKVLAYPTKRYCGGDIRPDKPVVVRSDDDRSSDNWPQGGIIVGYRQSKQKLLQPTPFVVRMHARLDWPKVGTLPIRESRSILVGVRCASPPWEGRDPVAVARQWREAFVSALDVPIGSLMIHEFISANDSGAVFHSVVFRAMHGPPGTYAWPNRPVAEATAAMESAIDTLHSQWDDTLSPLRSNPVLSSIVWDQLPTLVAGPTVATSIQFNPWYIRISPDLLDRSTWTGRTRVFAEQPDVWITELKILGCDTVLAYLSVQPDVSPLNPLRVQMDTYITVVYDTFAWGPEAVCVRMAASIAAQPNDARSGWS